MKRLDLKIRDLQTDGLILTDAPLASLLHDSIANLVPAASSTSTGANTPVTGFGLGGSTSIANAAMARMANSAALGGRTALAVPVAGMQPHPLMTTTSVAAQQRQRESSAGAGDAKRRRQNASLGPMPIATSALAVQPVVAPGTPAAATPGSRATSAGPRTKKTMKKMAPHQQGARKPPAPKNGGISSRKAARKLLGGGGGGGAKANASSGDEESALSEGSGGSEVDASVTVIKRPSADGAAEEAGYEDDGDDNKLYCVCHSISHGNMVACDNENCPNEWFHWECVGLTQEPKGRWLCADCEKLPKNQLKLAR